jgi:DeoR/GlpR family transcriptional regulator of sugar metabolism
MLKSECHRQIHQTVEDNHQVTAGDPARHFDVTGMTVWRNLAEHDTQGLA